MVANVGDIESVVAIQGNAVGAIQFRFDARPAIATEAGLARTGNRRNDPLRVDFADKMILHFDEVEVAAFVEADFVRFVQFRFDRRAAVAGVSLSSSTGDRRQLLRFQVDAQHAMVAHFADVQTAVRSEFHAKGIRHVDLRRLAAVAVVGRLARAGHGVDCLGENR